MFFEFKLVMCDSSHSFQIPVLFKASGQNQSLTLYLFKMPAVCGLASSLVVSPVIAITHHLRIHSCGHRNLVISPILQYAEIFFPFSAQNFNSHPQNFYSYSIAKSFQKTWVKCTQKKCHKDFFFNNHSNQNVLREIRRSVEWMTWMGVIKPNLKAPLNQWQPLDQT